MAVHGKRWLYDRGFAPVIHNPALHSDQCNNGRTGPVRRGARPVNLPNSITMSRIVMIPLLLWILSSHFPWQGPNGEQEIAASVLFILASMTDAVDGYLARKH